MKSVGEAIEFNEYLNEIFDKYFRNHQSIEVENKALCLMEELHDLYVYENSSRQYRPSDELFSEIAHVMSDFYGLDTESVYYTLESIDFHKRR